MSSKFVAEHVVAVGVVAGCCPIVTAAGACPDPRARPRAATPLATKNRLRILLPSLGDEKPTRDRGANASRRLLLDEGSRELLGVEWAQILEGLPDPDQLHGD